MSKYKVGDKVVVDITGVSKYGESYEVSHKSMWSTGSVDRVAKPLSEYTEQDRAEGADTAWELARKIYLLQEFGGYSTDELVEIFGTASIGEIFRYTYPEATAKVEAWEKAKEEIKVGDVVSHEEKYGVVISEGTICFRGFTDDGTPFEWYKERCTKTGRHIDIDSFLKQIREEQK